MPITVLCPACRKKLQAPDTSAGKRAKCPHCGQLMELPAPVYEAEEVAPEPSPVAPSSPFGGSSPRAFDEMYSVAGPRVNVPPPEPQRRACPACGELIVSGAAKCRFCGEVFDATLKRKERRQRGSRDDDDNLTTLEWVVAIFCSCVGCIFGVIWLIQGRRKGMKMIAACVLATILWIILRLILTLIVVMLNNM